MTLSVSPFSVQLPVGYALPASASATPATTTSPDVVTIGRNADAGSFTGDAGDVYSLSSLFKGSSATGGAKIADYKVALGDGGGELTLNGTVEPASGTFTAAQFAQLTYTAGSTGTQQSIVVTAQTGTTLANGTLTGVVDSPAEQITNGVTGTRSLAATAALTATPSGTDTNTTNVINLVKETAIFAGLGSTAPPATQTAGNFTAVAGDVYNMSDLFKGTTPTGSKIAGYRVALGDGGGALTLNGVDVSTQTSFTAAQFADLTYTAGPNGDQQDLVVAAQTGKTLANGTLTAVVDSSAVQITANVTGTRSLNATAALSATPAGTDTNQTDVINLVHETSAFSGLGSSGRPTLTATGNFTAQAGDVYSLSDLFKGSAPSGSSIAGYRVALGDGGGTLTLNGVDVTGQTSFTAAQFAQLTYTTGANGDQQDLVVAAQTGKRLANGTLTGIVDSQAVRVTADVTGSRSINATAALTATPTGTDTNTGNVIQLVRETGIFAGLGAATPPSLATAGNFSAVAGDTYNMADLFLASAPKGSSIAGYRVALGDGGGQLWLNGSNVSTQTSFTAAQFAQLTYVAGPTGDLQSLVVAAQTGKTQANGTLTGIVDSPAEAITATVSGTRSVNAMAALASTPSGTDTNQSNVIALVKAASVFTGLVSKTPPTLATAGNFTAQAGDVYSMIDLFKGSAPKGSSIAGYRVALGDGGGTLTLNGVDVTNQTSFSATDFGNLTYTAGTSGSQDLVVAAQTGTTLANGTLTGVVDSPAVTITATTGSQRSLNADAALTAIPTGTDSNQTDVIELVQQSAVFSGLTSGATPTLQTALAPRPPASADTLGTATGAYAVASLAAGSPVNLASFDPTSVGGSSTSGVYADPSAATARALLLLDATATGSFRTSNLRLIQSQAIAAYSSAQAL